MESAEYPHAMVPTLGTNSLLLVLPSFFLGDGSSTGTTALWIHNSEMAAFVEVVFIYNEYILGNPQMNCRQGNNTRKEWVRKHKEGLYNKQEQILNIC